MKVSFFDFDKENKTYINDIVTSTVETLYSGQFVLGDKNKQFEYEFAEYLGTKYCLGVGNGLDAIKIILLALGIKQNSEVIVPAHTFIATWLPVTDIGAKIVPIEPDINTYNMDVNLVERSITEKTKAIVPVHLYGQPADMEALIKIGDRYGIPVIEDAAQAHGACDLDGKKCGNLGLASAFSFYPTKNLGACGDAGAVVTNDPRLYEKMKMIRNYGSAKKYQHECFGLNSRMDELQAGILVKKLKHLDEFNNQRCHIAQFYDQNIISDLLIKPKISKNHVWHQYVLRTGNRDAFINHLKKKGIETLIHYPIPPHRTGVYKEQFSMMRFPVTESICSEVVSLPIYPGLSLNEMKYVVDCCNQYRGL